MKNKEPKSFIEIDKDALDEEWILQPKRYYRYAEKLADARLGFDTAKAHLDVVRATLDLEIRSNPGDFDIKRVSEKAVESAILLSDKYQTALEELNQSKFEMGVMQAAVDALDHRKKALESLVYLHGQNYFSSPQAPENQREVMSDIVKRSVRSKGIKKG